MSLFPEHVEHGLVDLHKKMVERQALSDIRQTNAAEYGLGASHGEWIIDKFLGLTSKLLAGVVETPPADQAINEFYVKSYRVEGHSNDE